MKSTFHNVIDMFKCPSKERKQLGISYFGYWMDHFIFNENDLFFCRQTFERVV
jgi:hypothetical protein